MELRTKSRSYDITRYEETWADSVVTRTVVFAGGLDPSRLVAELTADELSEGTVSGPGGEVSLPALSVQAVNRVLLDSGETVAGVFTEA